MSLQVGAALQDGVDDLTSQRGGLFVAVFVVFGLINTVLSQSLSLALTERFIANLDQPGAATQQPDAFGASGTPLAVDIPLAVSGALVLLLSVISIVISVVAVRAFASESPEPIPPKATQNLVKTTVTAIAATIITGIATVVGFALLIIPGLILTVLFYFVIQEIALNDSGVIESIQGSIGLVTDNVLSVVALVVILFVLGLLVGLPTVFLPSSLVLTLVTTVIGQIIGVFGIASVTSAYQQAAAERTETAL